MCKIKITEPLYISDIYVSLKHFHTLEQVLLDLIFISIDSESI